MTLTIHSEYRIFGLFKDPIDVSEVSFQDKVNFEIRYMRMSHRKNDCTRSRSKNLDQSTTHISKQINNTPGYTRFKNNIFTIKFNLEYLPVIAWISGPDSGLTGNITSHESCDTDSKCVNIHVTQK